MILKDKAALVTGSSRGVGKAVALGFAKEGANVVVNYTSNEQAAQNVKDEIESSGGKCEIRGFDVSSSQQVNEHIDSIINDHGELNYLVNNAGITRPHRAPPAAPPAQPVRGNHPAGTQHRARVPWAGYQGQ